MRISTIRRYVLLLGKLAPPFRRRRSLPGMRRSSGLRRDSAQSGRMPPVLHGSLSSRYSSVESVLGNMQAGLERLRAVGGDS